MPVSKESRRELGKALAVARDEAGLTVVELAQRAMPGRTGGLSRYYDAEAGRRLATSETVGHYASVLDRPDLHDLRSKILSRRPRPSGQTPTADSGTGVGAGQALGDGLDGVSTPGGDDTGLDDGIDDPAYSLPHPELLPQSLEQPLAQLLADGPTLADGTVVRGRVAVVQAACALMEEAIELSRKDGRSVSVQVLQLNPRRTFTRDLLDVPQTYRQLFPFQIQRLTAAGGSVRHLLSNEIMRSMDHWVAFERFIALMELTGDYSVYWLSEQEAPARIPDYLVIENVAALEIYPTDPLTWIGDAAVIHRDESRVLGVLQEYGENLIAEADEAFQVTDPSSSPAVDQGRVWVDQAILTAEQLQGARILVKYGLSSLCAPLKPYEARILNKHGLSPRNRSTWPIWVKQDLELRRRRLANFLKQIENHRTIEIIPRSALDQYVADGWCSEDGAMFGDFSVPVEERIQHLRDLMTLIRTNRLYDIVIVDDDPPLSFMAGAGLVMMGSPDEGDADWLVFYQSEKPHGGSDDGYISVAFETSLELFRAPVGRRIGRLSRLASDHTTQASLRILHHCLDELEAGRRPAPPPTDR